MCVCVCVCVCVCGVCVGLCARVGAITSSVRVTLSALPDSPPRGVIGASGTGLSRSLPVLSERKIKR